LLAYVVFSFGKPLTRGGIAIVTMGCSRPCSDSESIMTSPAENTSTVAHHDAATRHLHWFSALLILALWVIGQTIDDFAKGTPRVMARSVHFVVGFVLVAVFAVRVSRRFRGQVQHFEPRERIVELSHVGIYVLMGLVLVLGVLNASLRTDSFFGWFRFPRLIEAGGDGLRETVEDLHALAANGLVLVAAGHAAMAVFHQYVRKTPVLTRMLPPSKS
jgi:cytochrome b561